MKRILTAVAVTALLGTLPAAAASVSDISGHWAQATIQSWVDSGKISGYPDGTFKPENNISRAEMVTLINKAYSLSAGIGTSFTDVPTSNWAYAEVQKGVANGYVSGDGNGLFRPNSTITRAEAAVMLAKINSLGTTQDYSTYKDNASIASWAKPYVSAVTIQGVMNGYPDGSFGPDNRMTRAEAVTAINKALAKYQPKPPVVDEIKDLTVDSDKALSGGTYKSVTITKAGASLKDMTVNNDLTITSGVGSGNVSLNNMTIKGDLVVKGGGSNSVYLYNCQVTGDLIADKSGVSIKMDADAKINGNVLVRNDVSFQSTSSSTKAKLGNVIVDYKDSELTIGSKVTINTLKVDKNATGVKLTIDGTVGTLTPNAKVTVKGSGTINKLENSSNASVSGNITIGNGSRVSSVSLNKSSATVDIGSTITLTASISPTDSYNKKINWSSNDTSVATVDSSGVVKGIKAGTATIRATADENSDKYATCSITVNSNAIINVTGVSIAPAPAKVSVGGTVQLSATITPNNATNKNVTWSSSDTGTATVNATSGLVTGVKTGTATITVKTNDGSKTATCIVTVENTPVTGITLSPTDPSVKVGETVTLQASVVPTGATDKNVTWSSDKTDIATVNANGIVTGVNLGTATITATSVSDTTVTATCTVTVTEAPAAVLTMCHPSHEFSLTDAPDAPGTTLAKTLQITAADAATMAQGVTWSIDPSGSDIVTLTPTSDSFTVTVNPLKVGTVTVIATSKADPKLTATFEITITAGSTEPGTPEAPESP